MMYTIASSPHNRQPRRTSQIMRMVCYACIPGILAQYYFFGAGNLIQIALAIAVALAAEALVLKMRNKPIRPQLADCSAILTAVLLGVCLPPLAPWWIAVLGSAFAIIVVKQLYGGLGSNPFNPAMASYVFLLISFPLQMTMWLPASPMQQYELAVQDAASVIFTGYSTEGYSLDQLRTDTDGQTMATPLDSIKTDLTTGMTVSESLTQSQFTPSEHSLGLAGLGWEVVNLAFLLGGLVLLQLKVIKWQIPIATLSGITSMALLGQIIAPDQTAGVLIHAFSGATMFAAFFIATDPVSASTTDRGRLIYGFSIGALTYVIRTWGGYPDAFAFAVLLTNMAVPLIDQFTQPKVYGQTSKKPQGNNK